MRSKTLHTPYAPYALDADLVGYYGPESMSWKVGSEAALILGGGRAVLMQLAHPLVAAGVGQHSAYGHSPWGRTGRTIELMEALTFGTRQEAKAAAHVINRLHIGVTGALPEAAGTLSSGATYRARDVDLLLWVYATLIDTGLLVYPLFVRPLTPAEEERYYRESKETITLLGLPKSAIPATLTDFRAYMHEMLEGDVLAVTPPAYEVARVVMHMPLPQPYALAIRPLLGITEQITAGLLPPRLRAMYGYTWDSHRQMLLEALGASLRTVTPFLPSPLHEMPKARAARRRLRQLLPQSA